MEKLLKINIPEGYEIDAEKSTFAEIVFKPISSLKTWEECVRFLKTKGNPFYYIADDSNIRGVAIPNLNSENYNLIPSKEDAEKFLILQKLWTCRKAYIEDWKPDWTDYNTSKYVIKVNKNKLMVDYYYSNSRPFSFPTLVMAEEFLKNFKSDLEFVKDLL